MGITTITTIITTTVNVLVTMMSAVTVTVVVEHKYLIIRKFIYEMFIVE